jgi:hypothetical protein
MRSVRPTARRETYWLSESTSSKARVGSHHTDARSLVALTQGREVRPATKAHPATDSYASKLTANHPVREDTVPHLELHRLSIPLESAED